MNSLGLGRLPLRVRLVAGLVVLVAVGLLVAGLAATSALRGYQLDRVDAQLAESVRPALRDGDGLRGGPGEARRGPRNRLPGERYVALLDADGTVLRSDTVDTGPQLPSLTAAEVRERGTRPFTVPAANGNGSWRVVAVPARGMSVVVATDLREVDLTVQR
ncbi:MAG: two-component sensor histidine kinase, partial [Actinomycetota bacterium]|nr:two-component sensor histidine kinase [Actinomycetota bacterium]